MELNFDLADIERAAKNFIEGTGGYKIFLFDGEMGAGKTTFIKELCRQYGVIDQVSSPTFSIINEYRTNDGNTIFHLDLYRVNDEQEAIRAGVEECFYSDATCFVEWPFNARSILPTDAVLVRILALANGQRKLSVTPSDIP